MKLRSKIRARAKAMLVLGFALVSWVPILLVPQIAEGQRAKEPAYVMIGFNDLGMHCMNQDFSEICILPPFNNLHAQIIRRGAEPSIMRSGFTVTYSIANNTNSTTKTNFWDYDQALFGVNLAPNVGLTGNGLSGTMTVDTVTRQYVTTGIPVTPVLDDGTPNAYPQAVIRATGRDKLITSTVIPVSWEISCNLCHIPEQGESVATDILRDHDRLHGTTLVNEKPVLCARCHADPALGTAGSPGVSKMSTAMHGAHATRMGQANLTNPCYACHPGIQTDCQRDVHKTRGIECTTCHGGMAAVGDPNRMPWVDEPKCGSCHVRNGWDFEEPGKNFKESRGHGGVQCATCHGSPHVIAPSTNEADNLQMKRIQGRAGTLNKCEVCHIRRPGDSFFHRISED